jgi:hypothetical protein
MELIIGSKRGEDLPPQPVVVSAELVERLSTAPLR